MIAKSNFRHCHGKNITLIREQVMEIVITLDRLFVLKKGHTLCKTHLALSLTAILMEEPGKSTLSSKISKARRFGSSVFLAMAGVSETASFSICKCQGTPHVNFFLTK